MTTIFPGFCGLKGMTSPSLTEKSDGFESDFMHENLIIFSVLVQEAYLLVA